ncbi:unnamed protein product [Polarella glacialis]|uniref:Uncharacterized protein n=1 Tax=Polarella glacialis TaxID=89957 RepID=A0A813EDB5_POLGL|nr:unnamed protein product [Polarella glacialis]
MTNHQQLKAPLLALEASKSPSASPSSASPVSTKSDEEATKLRRAICVSLCLMVIEIIGGILANSLAIITDAMHLLSDVGGFALSLLALHFMKQQATAKYSFGFHQAGSLGGLISVMLVWILAGALLVQATHRMFEPEPVDGPVMSGIATLGFLANVLMYAVLGHSHGGSACEGHGHAHGGGNDHGHAHGGSDSGHKHGGECNHDSDSGKSKGKSDGHGHGDGHAHGEEKCDGHGHGEEKSSGHGHGHGKEKEAGHGHGHGKEKEGGHGNAHGGKEKEAGHGHAHGGKEKEGADGHAHGGKEKEGAHGHAHGEEKCDGHGHGGEKSSGHGHGHGKEKEAGHGHGHGKEKEGGHGNAHGKDHDVESGHSCSGHAHDDDHEEVASAYDQRASILMQAAMIHVIGDMVQSVGVMLAGFLIWLEPFDIGTTPSGLSNWVYADPVCTFLFSILVVFTTIETVRQAVAQVLMSVPDAVDAKALKAALCKQPHVLSVHDLHVWQVGSGMMCTGHLVIDSQEAAMEVLEKVTLMAQDKHRIGHTTFQIEVDGLYDHSIEHLRIGDASCHELLCNDGDTCRA